MADPLRIPIKPHAKQAEILTACLDPEVQVVAAGMGRQVGKTETCKMLLAEEAARCHEQYKAAYCAPTYKRAGGVYEEMAQNLKPLIARKRDSEHIIELRPYGRNQHGSKLFFWSLEEHDNLRGENLHRVIVDECSDVAELAWRATLMPMLLARGGRALLLGTPKRVGVGFVWFRAEWLKGTDREAYRTYRSFAAPSTANPALKPEALALLTSNMTPDVYREEILAEWLTEEGAVFERVEEACVIKCHQEGPSAWVADSLPPPDVRCVIGYDIASHEDYNIFSVWRLDTKEQVAVYRFRGERFEDVLARLHDVRARFNRADIYADGNGMGAPIVQRLADRYGDGVVDKKWGSNAAKQEDVTEARLLFQRAEWRFLDVKWQKAEFLMYTREKTAGGVWRYSAPEGAHDDAVAAACMVAQRISHRYIPNQKAPAPEALISAGPEGVKISSAWFDAREAWDQRRRDLWPWNTDQEPPIF